MKKSQLRKIVRESIKQLMNEQSLTCYTCVNTIIYSTNAFTSTTGPYHVGNVCGQTPVNQALTYISYTGNAASVNGAQSTALGNPVTELVFFDTISGNTFFDVMGCTLPDPVEPTDPVLSDDPCDIKAWENHAKTNHPQLALEPFPLWKLHFCEYCMDGTIPPGTDPFCKCCKPTDKPTDIEPTDIDKEVEFPEKGLKEGTVHCCRPNDGMADGCCAAHAQTLCLEECGGIWASDSNGDRCISMFGGALINVNPQEGNCGSTGSIGNPPLSHDRGKNINKNPIKKSQLRKIVRESIKQLIKEENTVSYNDNKRSGICKCNNGQLYTCEWNDMHYVYGSGTTLMAGKSCCEHGPPPSWCMDGGDHQFDPFGDGETQTIPFEVDGQEISKTITKSSFDDSLKGKKLNEGTNCWAFKPGWMRGGGDCEEVSRLGSGGCSTYESYDDCCMGGVEGQNRCTQSRTGRRPDRYGDKFTTDMGSTVNNPDVNLGENKKTITKSSFDDSLKGKKLNEERAFPAPPEILDALQDKLQMNPLIRYVEKIKALNSIPPAYRVFLLNGEHFDVYYEDFSLLIKIGAEEYYINDQDERNYAKKDINKLLTRSKVPGFGDEEETEPYQADTGDTTGGGGTTQVTGDEPADEPADEPDDEPEEEPMV